MRSKYIFILHTPPPFHGSSIVGELIKSSKVINQKKIIYLSNNGSKSVSKVNSFEIFKILNPLKNYILLITYLISKNITAIYLAPSINGKSFLRDFIYVVIGKIFKTKIILHLHNKGVYNNSKRAHYPILYKYFFKGSYCMVLSEKLRYDISNYVEDKMIYICQNGLRDENREEKFKNQNEVKVLWVSNLIKTKGILILLEAIQLIVQRNRTKKFSLTIVGADGDIKKTELQRIINEKKIQTYVKLVGKKVGNDKYKLFEDASIFVFPTFYPLECLPLVLIEAMMFECALISTSEGGINDLLIDNENGFICQKNSAQDLSLKLENLIEDHEKVKLFGQRSRKLFEQKFEIKKFENRFYDILNSIESDVIRSKK